MINSVKIPSKSKAKSKTQEWFTPAEAAEYLRVTRQTIYNMMSDGSLPYYELTAIRGRRLRREDLEGLFTRHTGSSVGAGDGSKDG